MSTLVQRVVNVAKLDVPTFEEVEHNESLTTEAGIVVAVVSVIGSLGALFSGSLLAFIGAIIVSLLGWGVWSFITAFIAQRFLGGTTDVGEMLRATGYAWAPQALGIIPFLGFIGMIWSLVAIVIGVRQAGDFSTGKAVIAAIVGFILYAIAMGLVMALFR